MSIAKCQAASRRLREHGSAASAAVLLIAAATPAAAFAQVPAQQAASTARIEPGARVTQAFPAGSGDTDNVPFHDYELQLRENQTVSIAMTSPDPGETALTPPDQTRSGFDTYLELRRAGEETPLRSNDDSGGTLNSFLVFTAPSAGAYIVRARPLGYISETQARTYVLQVAELPSPPPPVEMSEGRVEGELGAQSPVDDMFGPVRYAAYHFSGNAGERVQLSVRSSSSQPTIQLIDDVGTVVAVQTGFDTEQVNLITVLPETGRYVVRVLSPQGNQPVRYSLEMTRATAAAVHTTQPVRIGESVQREFTLMSSASLRPDGSGTIDSFYQLFTFEVQEGRPVTVTLSSADFDPMLEVGTASVLGFVPAFSAADYQTMPARIVVEPFQSGTVWARVRSAGLEVGSFQFAVTPGIQPTEATPDRAH